MSADVSPARALKDLAVVAVLGSDRAARGGETPMGVLVGAAVAGARLRAGRRCCAAVQRIDECPIETGVVASEKQVATLERLLALSDAAMIEEWCSLAKTRGLRVPRDVVPRLLAWWAKQPSRAPEVFEATGACGIWLAGLNPEWRKPVVLLEIPERADEVWQTGSAAERVAILRTVRQRDPARALEMLRATFGVDGAEERRKFVEVLATGVSAGDEPFLESVLDDRSKTVRREAARVLARCAGSALRERMRQRAAGMIVVEKTKGGLLRRTKVTMSVEPPKELEAAWERDGVEENAIAGKGKRASWMVQVLSAMDMADLSERSGLGPAEVIEALRADAFFGDVMGAMVASVAACPGQREAGEWCDAIIEHYVEHEPGRRLDLSEVWNSRPVEQSEALRLRMVSGAKGTTGGGGVQAWHVLTSDARAWSLGFSRRAAAVVAGGTFSKTDNWELWAPIEAASRLLHPGAAEEFEKLIGGLFSQGASDSVRKSLDRVRLRADMHREFGS
jgi:hypothetical protein